MLRKELSDALKTAMKARDATSVSTVRLILAALKDRDIAARGSGMPDGIGDDEILEMLQKMIRQRRDSIVLYEQGGRLELAEKEQDEIGVIERFLPRQMDEASTEAAVATVIDEIGAEGLKDMGRIMAALKARFSGRMDFGRASAMVRARLA